MLGTEPVKPFSAMALWELLGELGPEPGALLHTEDTAGTAGVAGGPPPPPPPLPQPPPAGGTGWGRTRGHAEGCALAAQGGDTGPRPEAPTAAWGN